MNRKEKKTRDDFTDNQADMLTLEDSVRMSLESLTRHCRGTVTSMTFAFSCFWLVSETNFPYQAFRMIRPGQ